MGLISTFDFKFDPSGIKQEFKKINLNVHCCRYWKLSHWEYRDLSFSFWRLYYNTIEGASIQYKKEEISLNRSKVVLIPPFTSFSTSLKRNDNEGLRGSRIEKDIELDRLKADGMIDHLFIHFNLGFHFDYIKPGFYVFEVDEQMKKVLNQIRFSTIKTYQQIDFQQSLIIYALILKLVSGIETDLWKGKTDDTRILKIIEHIDVYYYDNLTNEYLARLVNMAPNSFLRLFREAMGITIQRYLQQVRINKSILEMHNSLSSIDQIAARCGFSDRHHFSKVFKRTIGISPGIYRQQKIYY